jgi:hypothetical protein
MSADAEGAVEIVRVLAARDPRIYGGPYVDKCGVCFAYCGYKEELPHSEDCPWLRAKKWVEEHDAAVPKP